MVKYGAEGGKEGIVDLKTTEPENHSDSGDVGESFQLLSSIEEMVAEQPRYTKNGRLFAEEGQREYHTSKHIFFSEVKDESQEQKEQHRDIQHPDS